MCRLRKTCVGALALCLSFLAFSMNCCAQTDAFDSTQYQQFLDQHQNMMTSDLLEMHPTGGFVGDVNLSWESVGYHDLIEAKYELSSHEKHLLSRNGFVVTERLKDDSFVGQFVDIWRADLPLFISTDAILHALHYYYDTILMQIELGMLHDHLTELLSQMHAKLPELFLEYASNADMLVMFEDVDLYLTVPRRLLGDESVHAHIVDDAVVNEVLRLIEAEGIASYPLFSTTCREIDFSQFTPRGHYTQNETLARYFQAMIWLGRTEMYLLAPQNVAPGPCGLQSNQDIQRQTIDAVLLLELVDLAEVDTLYTEMETIFSLLVGEQDNVALAQLQSILSAAHVDNAGRLLDATTLEDFQQLLVAQSFDFQRTQSQVLRGDPTTPEAVQPASAFLLFGQRFVIDSYITGNVVFDKITYQDESICRLFPSTLDVLAGLGNNVAMGLLTPELDQYHYSSNLAALRYLVDGHDQTFWDSSIYNMWLNSVRTLNPRAQLEYLPMFMQTEAWWRQKLNTQLASWTQIRHDNLLYAKQSYTIALGCSYQCAYVEPFPEFFQCLNNLAVSAQAKFFNIPFSDNDLKQKILDYYSHLETVTGTLRGIARKELDGVVLEADEIKFMDEILYKGFYGVLQGWYMLLLNGTDYMPELTPTSEYSDYLVADYHTTPTDCAGAPVGWISHAGTGPIDLAIVVAPTPYGEKTGFVGPVMSYYEYTTTDFQRLTDEEWQDTYLSLAARPEWTDMYLAGNSGE